MKTRDIVVGFVLLVILISGILLVKKTKDRDLRILPQQTPSSESKIKETFSGLSIPDDVEKVELRDVSGGEGYGIVTKTEILANLPDPKGKGSYQVFFEKDQKQVYVGQMRQAKGGWILEYNPSNYVGFNKINITLDKAHILEGSF